ncbi:MAG: Holliday junction resolvase RuvX [Betaproteobacteria bacterium]|nr:Holliday junction resolvase RuvX [Betaproteobacteria bacterium]NDE92524.1 Holliday junction resolvase RuvX [Betaproteobacteria bacterium]
MPETQIVLGFDVSLNRVGVAIGNRITRDARPLMQINSPDKQHRFAEIARLISAWEPETLVVGVPSHPDGAPLPNTTFCLRFANQLRGRFSMPVAEVNENYSSVVAKASAKAPDLANSTRLAQRQRDDWFDAQAAVQILEQYLHQ